MTEEKAKELEARIEKIERLFCTACEGTGGVTCPACGGSSCCECKWHKQGQTSCDDCYGTGRRIVQER